MKDSKTTLAHKLKVLYNVYNMLNRRSIKLELTRKIGMFGQSLSTKATVTHEGPTLHLESEMCRILKVSGTKLREMVKKGEIDIFTINNGARYINYYLDPKYEVIKRDLISEKDSNVKAN